ncbi:MAG: TIM44-like domain-containing protein [Solirubrobacteraceae bacterium]
MVLAVGVYVPPVPDSGLPVWQEVPLTILAVAIAFGLMYGVLALSRLPAQRRLRRRVQAVEAAAAESSVYGPAVVYAAAARLFGEVMAAWDAGDRERLRGLSDPDLMSDWTKRVERYAAAGGRYRVEVLTGPRLGYVGLLGDRGQVRVRVRAKLRRALELSSGKRRALPEDKGRQRVAIEEYWTLSRSDGEWILWSTRDAGFRAEYSTEPIVPPTATHAATPAASKLPEPPVDGAR